MEKEIKPETQPEVQMPKQPVVQMFAISFDTKKNALSFVGNMPVEQAIALLQGILRQQQTDKLREEIKVELTQQTKVEAKKK